ncbi:hypothetical protein IW140_005350 [Coemansia sp. RSA 1813]|nr:hypothetical protein LPJ74_004347 [Coemansia sp. RSA 1843]KAJ2211688.1 hypothetical protein EV179_005304 [Coemansia sp. RSA 487]KAJ2565358.1 hypothetical protein IW140_005350 [Coemansia sp. RSA 1813]
MQQLYVSQRSNATSNGMRHLLLRTLAIVAVIGSMASVASAHGDEHEAMGATAGTLPDDAPFYRWPEEPMDWALKVHLALCLIAFVLVLPTALAMEMANNKFHPLVQIGGALIGFLGIVFGWVHGHLHNAYARFGWFMLALLVVQTAANVCFTLGILKKTLAKLRISYRILGCLQLFFTYMAMLLGVIRYLNLCSQGHLGQCISHFARGTALIYGSVALLFAMRLFGATMLDIRRPPELFISIIMMVVGLIGTFTEHNFFQSSDGPGDMWSHKDLQHTFIGISWFAGGALGVFMSWKAQPSNRTPVPSLIFIATGIAMIIHQQDLVMSSHAHFLFGASLVTLGLSTICEITMLASGIVKDRDQPMGIQYLSVFFMCASGMALMGANRDMVLFLINSNVDVATYGLILMSFCFVIVFYFYVLLDVYFAMAGPREPKYMSLEDALDQDSQRTSTSSQTSTLNHEEGSKYGMSPNPLTA